MRISDWSSDVCSSDLRPFAVDRADAPVAVIGAAGEEITAAVSEARAVSRAERQFLSIALRREAGTRAQRQAALIRSEEHTSELQSLMRNSYAVCCLQKKKQKTKEQNVRRQNIKKQNIK